MAVWAPNETGIIRTGPSTVARASISRVRSAVGRRTRWCATAGIGLALVLSPTALGSAAANPTIDVTFSVNGPTTVTLPDGTPVGSASGQASVIPAGYYTIVMSGPGGCTQTPLFDLTGPGENILSDMSGGELNTQVVYADFQPNSTYSWRMTNVNPPVVYTFTTSSTVEGTPQANSTTGASATAAAGSASASSENLIGSAAVSTGSGALLGSLGGTVSAGGKVALMYRGKPVATLAAGRYSITVVDKSHTSGFMLGKRNDTPTGISGTSYVGKATASVELTAGRWYFSAHGSGPKTYFTVTG